MTREEAIAFLEYAGKTDDNSFPTLEATIACALHDVPFRDASPVRQLVEDAAKRLRERVEKESPDEALTETMAGDFRLNGDLLNDESTVGADIIDVTESRRGLSALLVILYLEAARRAGLEAAAVDFPGHVLLRVETPDGPVALDPFSQGRLVLPSELTRRALHAGLTLHVADRLDLLMAPISERQAVLRLQNIIFARAMQMGEYELAERSAYRRALLDPADHRPWLDVATARERQGILHGAMAAIAHARELSETSEVSTAYSLHKLRLRLN
ncbi:MULTISPECIES: transglutaminase family protein [unclassified Brevundimonas]|uniref:transglutaminase family protein n=1 Tax=unclassified Brevundimonas TaxID=2622653 RepID=UPI0025BD3159|nr:MULTISPECIES: transglutaminase family protein [unclassified Brevundimonas]